MVEDFRKRFWISLSLTVPVLFLSPTLRDILGLTIPINIPGSGYIQFIFSSAVFFYGGWPFLSGLYDELKKKEPGMMTLIGLAVLVAYIYSSAVVFGLSGKIFFWELVTLIDIMLLGHWIEMKSVMGASMSLKELAKLLPSEAHRLKQDGNTEEVPIDRLSKEDMILVKPGEKIPVDSVITEGESSVNESMVTGESTPAYKKEGDDLIGGTLNGEGSIKAKVARTGKDTFLSQMMDLVENAQKSRSRSQDLANRAAKWLTFIAITCGTITFFSWLMIIERDFPFSMERAVTVMVITCPHALGLAVPLVIAVSTAIAAGNGLLIRDRSGFERGKKIDVLLFDKTGTLTRGEFGVTDVIPFEKDMDENKLLNYAAAVEFRSEHPIAKGITNAAENRLEADNFEAIPGQGAKGEVEGKEIKVVSRGYLKENGMPVDDNRVNEYSEQGKTVVFIVIDNKVAGAVALADIIRDESKEAVIKLSQMGIKCIMITGDNERAAKWVSEEIGITKYYAGVKPEDKAKIIEEMQSRQLSVAMTGDGINDAPALAKADMGIAIGAGTDVAAQTADIILVNSNPMDVVSILRLSRATYKKMVQNLAWATGYNALAIPLAGGVLYNYGFILSPAAGALLMSLSTVIVAVNARFLKINKT
ncbi:MAG: cadmium-translocating P-type ATPase [Deltaproteobacteria bacterium]|nr:cadmium-translocating P-type ATPase [Deltaproteobacteria bacterium]